MNALKRLLAPCCLLVLFSSLCAKDPDPARWEKNIAAFEALDAAKSFPEGGVVFTGSSSIALWKDLDKHFAKHHVLNRGFGGSTLPDVNHYLERIVTKHKPKTVVLFCGGNDLANKRMPEQVHADFQTFVAKVHAKVPEAQIVYLSIHLPPGRKAQAELIDRVNSLIEATCKKDPKLAYVDVHSLMLAKKGEPNAELYRDTLHPNAKAYEMWAEKIRAVLK